MLILHDATEWASAEQRFEKTFNANPAPAVICRLSDYRYVKVNVGFLEMTGYARDQVIGRSVYELDVLDQAERRELAWSAWAPARPSRRWRRACGWRRADASAWWSPGNR